MKTEFWVEGMTCEACKYKIEHLLKEVEGVVGVNATYKTGKVEIVSNRNIESKAIQAALAHTAKYFIKSSVEAVKPTSKMITYKPLFIVFGYITAVSLTAAAVHSQHFLMNFSRFFMAGFFIVFSFFKMLDVPAFASSFSMYDVVAKRIYAYGFLYPFFELALGILFIINFNPFFTNLATLILMSVGTVGVLQTVFNKKQIQCACLGTVFNLPMSYLTIVENSIMIVMSLLMLIFM